LRSLQYFVEAARTGSFSGAARTLSVSVQAVIKGVKALETAMGAVVFERSARGLTLTAGGVAYL
jgi:DNA-binding transcriptional LysR family regulator